MPRYATLDNADVRDIVFDLGGVLIDWHPKHLYYTHLGEDLAAVEDFLATVCTPRWQSTIDAGRSFSEASADLERRFPEHREWIRRYEDGWEHMFRGTLEEPLEYFHRLADRGYRLHALSNYPGEKIAFLYRTHPFMQQFHTVVISGLVGNVKPEAAIFDYLSERIDGRPCVFIDDRAENVSAARRCGLGAVCYRDGISLGELVEGLLER